MTALEQWAIDMAKHLLKRDVDERLLAIALIQARAKEMRHQSTELQVRGKGLVSTQTLSAHFFERSCLLEKVGERFAEQYPPVEEPKRLIEVVQ
jgi:hypothetical protein